MVKLFCNPEFIYPPMKVILLSDIMHFIYHFDFKKYEK